MCKISIIVPVYNIEKYLNQCLKSLINQTLKSIEIILIDDGSTDSSGLICDEYSKKYSNIVVIHQKNQGQSCARNAGLRKATGEYVMFVDGDDWIRNEACEKLYLYAKRADADVVWADVLNEKNKKMRKKAFRFHNFNKIITGEEFLIDSIDSNSYDIVPWLKILKRDFVINNKLFFLEGCFYEDQEYTLKLLLSNNGRFLRVYYPFYYYRTNRKGSTTNVFELKKGTDLCKVINEMIKLALKQKDGFKVRKYIDSVIALSVYHLSLVYVYMEKEDRKVIRSKIDSIMKSYAIRADLLPFRIKIQNFLFVYIPEILVYMYSLKNRFARLKIGGRK